MTQRTVLAFNVLSLLSLRSLRLLALAAGGLALTLSTLPASAQLQTPEIQGLTPVGDFQVTVDGELIEDAQIYRGARPPAFLILTPALPAPTLLVPGQGGVRTLHLMKLAKRADGTIDVLPGATLELAGAFQMDGQSVVFTVENKQVRLQEKPPLLGLHESDDLKEYSVTYQQGAAAYEPDAGMLTKLKGESKPVRVRIFFGSWCPLCSRTVPHIVRLADELEGSQIDFEFYGLPHGFGDEPEARKHGVTAVPTGIVFVDGKEAGRIQGQSWLRPEQVLQDILTKG